MQDFVTLVTPAKSLASNQTSVPVVVLMVHDITIHLTLVHITLSTRGAGIEVCRRGHDEILFLFEIVYYIRKVQ